MNIRKIISFVLILSMLLPAFCIGSAAETEATPTIAVGAAYAVAGETVDIPVRILNNPGISAAILSINYDETKLQLNSVTPSADFGGNFEYGTNAVWGATSDVSKNGTFMTVNFTVLEGAEPGNATVTVSYESGDICNANEEDVNFETMAGAVIINGPQFVVSSEKGEKGEHVYLDVSMRANPGICSFVLGIDYDETYLELNGATPNANLGGSFEFGTKAVWLAESDSNYNGKVFTLDFTVLATAPEGDTFVKVTYEKDDIANYDEESIEFECLAGKVTIPSASIIVSTGTAKVGAQATVDVAFDHNPGINAFVLGFDYDETLLQLDAVEVNPQLGGDFEYGTKAVWLAENDKAFNGTAFTLKFTVLPGAVGEIPVSVTYEAGDICNRNEDDVSFEIVAGAVKVPDAVMEVSTVSAFKGETAKVAVNLKNNPGINAAILGFEYDETRLSLKSASISNEFGGLYEVGEGKIAWVNENDVVLEGEFLVLEFDVLANAAIGNAEVKVVYATGDISNSNEKDVNFTVVNGAVKVFGTESPKLTLKNAEGSTGGTVNVDVEVANNPGFNAMIADLQYDKSALTLTNVTLATAMGEFAAFSEDTIAWANDADVTANGKIMTLTFKVNSKAQSGDYTVNLTYKPGNICNSNEEDVDFAVSGATVTVSASATVVRGDLDGDNKVTAIDVNIMKKAIAAKLKLDARATKAADINNDNKITAADANLLKMLLLGKLK